MHYYVSSPYCYKEFSFDTLKVCSDLVVTVNYYICIWLKLFKMDRKVAHLVALSHFLHGLIPVELKT